MTGEALSVTLDGSTVAVVYVALPDGRELAIAAEPRMARDIAEAIEYGERPTVSFESWAILWPHRGSAALR